MSDITSKLESLKAVASDKGATKGERDGAMLMIGKLVSKHDVSFSMPVAAKPAPAAPRRPSQASTDNSPSRYWSLYIPDAVLADAEFMELTEALKGCAFMSGNVFICTDFTYRTRITMLVDNMWATAKEDAAKTRRSDDFDVHLMNAPTYIMFGFAAIAGLILAVYIL